jgi:hypothetical protein
MVEMVEMVATLLIQTQVGVLAVAVGQEAIVGK